MSSIPGKVMGIRLGLPTVRSLVEKALYDQQTDAARAALEEALRRLDQLEGFAKDAIDIIGRERSQ